MINKKIFGETARLYSSKVGACRTCSSHDEHHEHVGSFPIVPEPFQDCMSVTRSLRHFKTQLAAHALHIFPENRDLAGNVHILADLDDIFSIPGSSGFPGPPGHGRPGADYRHLLRTRAGYHPPSYLPPSPAGHRARLSLATATVVT